MGMTRRLAWLLGIAAVLMLLLLPASASAGDSYTIDNDGGWSGKVSDVDWKFYPRVNFKLDFSSGDKVMGFIPVPKLKFSVSVEMGSTGSFDLDLKNGKLPAGTTLGTNVGLNSYGAYSQKISQNIFDYLPTYYGFGFDLETYLVAASSQPVKVKGTFDCVCTVNISADGITYDYHPNVEFTSIQPQTTEETFVSVGVHYTEAVNVGEVGWRDYTIGPILKGTIAFEGTGRAVVQLLRDEWSVDTSYVDNSVTTIHSCTENGREGCVKGTAEQKSDVYCDLDFDLTLPLIDYQVYHAHKDLLHQPQVYGRGRLVQSLTWKEKLKYQDYCDHMYYQVPVAVWANRNKTIPVAGIYVHHDGYVDIDSNISRFAYAKTGTNPTIPQPDREGKVNLYLPYKAGKYTIIVDRYNSDPQYINVSGSGTMPSNMRRGRNDRVDIILESSEKVTPSVRKEWDIDIENNDKPESVEVLLQAQYYSSGYFSWEGVQKATLNSANNWSHTFDEVPRYEMNAKGEMVEIKYRVRELKEASGGAAGGDGAGIGAAGEMLEDVIAEVDVVQNADGLYHPDGGALAAESKRVVPARWDLDNIHVWETIKKKTTDWNELWQISPSMSYLKSVAKSAIFPRPSVSYKVPEYTNLAGKHVDEHKTKYLVEYEENGSTTTIKNTAILDFAIYKRWLMLGTAEAPDSVYICLNYRLDDDYRQYAGAFEKFVGMWLPVFNPVDGNMINLFEIAGMDTLAKLDVLNKVSIPIAIGKAKKAKDNENPLTAWRVKFTVKKYGWLGIDGLPVEFQAQELSSTIVTDVLKFVTGVDIPISFSINPFSGDMYVTVPGFPLNIPGLDKDWEYTCNVINTWAGMDDDDVTAIGGTKVWVGDREEDRPDTLTLVVKDGETEVGRVTLDKGDYEGQDTWAWALKSNEVNEGVTLDSEKIYTVTEEFPEDYQYKDNYACTVQGHDLVNTWVNKPPKVVLKKVFVNATSSIKPDGISVELKDKNGNAINRYTLPVSTDKDVFTLTLDKDPDGNAWTREKLEGVTVCEEEFVEVGGPHTDFGEIYDITYSGPEITAEASDGGTAPVYTYTVTNSLKNSYLVVVRKVWEDDDPSSRPETVGFIYTWSGHEAPDTLRKEKNWESHGLWSTEAGVDLTVKEDPVPGYRSTVTRTVSGQRMTFQITNTPETSQQPEETVSVKGTKTWEDNDNEAGTRPESITIRVLTGSGPAVIDGRVAEKTVTASDGWAWEFAGLPKFSNDGEEISYSVIESVTETAEGETKNVPVPGYTVSYADPVYDEETRTWTCDVTNSTEKINVTVRKAWEDDDNSKGIRPETVTVRLTAKTDEGSEEVGTTEISSETGWTQIFRQLPEKDENDREITYSVTEDPVDGYQTEITSASDGFTVTNTDDGTRMNIRVTKVWQGDEAHAGDRPATVTVHLFRNGVETDSLLVSGRNGWVGYFRGVLKADENGNAYTYTLTEDRISGYEDGVITGSADAGFTVTNKFNNKMPITVIKEWDILDGSDESADRVPFVLMRNGERVFGSQMKFVFAAEGWKTRFEDLDKYDENGVPYSYSIKETVTLGPFKPSYDRIEQDDGLILKMINHQEERIITVYKVWDDEDNAGGTRPDQITVKLLADGAQYDSRTLNSAQAPSNTQSTLFLNCTAYRDSERKNVISYTVAEDPVDGYLTAVTGNMSDGFTITNTLVRDSKSITVTKNWVDEDNAYNNRPDTVTVRLLADGTEVSRKEFGAGTDGTWSCTFTGLQVYTTGTDGTKRAIVYTITEDPVPGYDSEIKGFTITNTLKRVDITAKKIWVDNNDAAGLRPESVDAMLYINGVYFFKYSGVMKPSNNWSYRQADMPAWQDGAEILYEVKEDTVPGYTGTVTGSLEDGFVITNSLLPSVTDITVTKEWIDGAEDAPSVTVILLSDKRTEGVMREVDRCTLTNTGSEKDWTHVFTDMPYYTGADNRIIKYSVQEEVPEGYGEPYYIENEPYSFTIQNWKKQFMEVRVKKTWEGDNEKNRPESVTVRLLANGSELTSADLTAKDGWETAFEKLEPMDENGVIEYTVTEDPVEGYETTIAEGDSTDLLTCFEITNAWIPPEEEKTDPPEPDVTPEHEVTPEPDVTPEPEVTPEQEKFAICFDPNKGVMNGSTNPVTYYYPYGEVITIPGAPVRDGYLFTYWKGSEYHPGDKYTVTGDHTFTAQWKSEGTYTYAFTFTKKWEGSVGDSIDWTLYNPDGSQAHKKFNKKVVSDTEWTYEAWFQTGTDYYLIETPPAGYLVRYENVGAHAAETDRCYNGGTIINYKLPKTGDAGNLWLWLAMVAAGLGISCGAVIYGRKKKKN